MTKHFDPPVKLADGRSLSGVDETIAALSDTGWPERGPRRDEALDICLKVRDGHRSVSEVRPALILAAQEANILG
ncbi:DUF982 domain-containing protein [Aliihoeflea aestuarii]|jgi:hypothetical protein|uniref:DUF982 domain-containing protein n=1 Tax=Aliihoeflea aestuarii TaxID=453840 RepID=UPI002092C9F7|nr:DUF982 domain-containing protein [Aliihoeflea aestuarii]MCO6391920.1 DUF982 domain-containing protein [Aliihoeflea aestuarii]